MSTPIEIVDDWLNLEDLEYDAEGNELDQTVPEGEICQVLALAREADKNAQLCYQIIGWMCAEMGSNHNIILDMDQILFRVRREFDMPAIFVSSEEAEDASAIILPPGVSIQ